MVTERAGAPPIARRKTKRKISPLLIVATIAIAGGLGWWGWTKSHPTDDATAKLLTDTAKKGDLVETVSATGSITAQTGAQVKIGSQITGTIKRLYADVGSKVKAGQTIAELDLPDIEAQLNQAQASLGAARTRLLQAQTGVGVQKSQTSSTISEQLANLNSAKARLQSAQAAANLQSAQTPNDIKRAQNAVNVATSALSTAQSNLRQVNASANLQIANAQEQVSQAKANATNAAVNLKRQRDLNAQGFVATSQVDLAVAADAVAQSQVQSATQSVSLVREKVKADIQSAQDQVAQAQQNVASARSNLESVQAETLQDKAKLADVENARAQVRQAEAAVRLAQGNAPQDVIKQQDVAAAQDAVRQAQAQVDYYRAQLAKTVIRSPISGTVLQLASQQGETLAAGLSAPTLIIVADLSRLQVDTYVDETDIGKVHLNQQAEITVDAFPKRAFKGHVAKVASGSTIQSGVITYDVTIALDGVKRMNPDAPAGGGRGAGRGRGDGQSGRGGAAGDPGMPGRQGGASGGPQAGSGPGAGGGNPMALLKPDMTASVTIETGKRSNVLLVPAEAIKVGTRGVTVNVVTMKEGKKNIEPHKIKIGATDGTFTEVRDGLNDGDTIVLAGMQDGKRGPGPSSPFGPSAGGGGGRRGN